MDIDQIQTITNGFVPIATSRNLDAHQTLIVTGHFDKEHFEPELYTLLEIQHPARFEGMATKRKADYLAGRIFAKLALNQLGTNQVDVPAGPDRAPIWPKGINGSLSHSHGHACCLVTKTEDMACGIDMEKIASGSAKDAILQKCLNGSERDWMRNQSDLAPEELATLLFSAKESIFKAYHGTIRHFFGFDYAEVQSRTDDNTLLFKVTETLHPTLPKGYDIPVHFNVYGNVVQTWIHRPAPKP